MGANLSTEYAGNLKVAVAERPVSCKRSESCALVSGVLMLA